MNSFLYLMVTLVTTFPFLGIAIGKASTGPFDSDYLLISGREKNDDNATNAFGASVVMVKSQKPGETWVFIGAPKSSDLNVKNSHPTDPDTVARNPGAVWKCKISNSSEYQCGKMQHTQQYCKQRLGMAQQQIINCTMANIGSTLAYGQDMLYMCAPNLRVELQKRGKTGSVRRTYLRGGCYGTSASSAMEKPVDLAETCFLPEEKLGKGSQSCRLMLTAVDFPAGAIPEKMSVMAGLSAQVPSVGMETASFLMGSPYWYEASGGATLFPNSDTYIPSDQKELMAYGRRKIKDATMATAKSQYFGYAVTSGKYFPGENRPYAALTSTNNNRLDLNASYLYDFEVGTAGAEAVVYVVAFDRFSGFEDATVASDAWLNGNEYAAALTEAEYAEFGSFFGYALASVDLDGDGGDELLIGSPLYGNGSDFDIGLVTVMFFASGMEKPNHVDLRPDIAVGNKGNRFGMSIAGVGDIDQDGVQDVAIAAPFEEDVGAVYLFCGSTTRNIQRCGKLKPEKHAQSGLNGFGYSLYHEDFDDNRTPDIGIGWIGRESVVIFRTRPTLLLSQIELIVKPAFVYENFTDFRITVSWRAHLKIQAKTDPEHLRVQLPLKWYFKVEPKTEYELTNDSTTDGKPAGPVHEIHFQQMTDEDLANVTITIRRKTEDPGKMVVPPAVVSYTVSYAGVEKKCISEIDIEKGNGTAVCPQASNYDFCPYCPHPHEEPLRAKTVEFCAVCNENKSLEAKCGNEVIPLCQPDVTITRVSVPKEGDFPLDSENDKLFLSFGIANLGNKIKTATVRASLSFSEERNVTLLVHSKAYKEEIPTFSKGSIFVQSFASLTGCILNETAQVINFTIPLDQFRLQSLTSISATFKLEVLLDEMPLQSQSLTYSLKPVVTGVSLAGDTEGEQVLKIGTIWKQDTSKAASLKFNVSITAKSLVHAELRILIPFSTCHVNMEESTFILLPRSGAESLVCQRQTPDALAKNKLLKHFKSCAETEKSYVYFVCDISDNRIDPEFQVEVKFNLSSPDAREIISPEAGHTTSIYAVGWLSMLGQDGEPYSKLAFAKYTFKIFDEFKQPIWVLPVAVLVGMMVLGLLVIMLWKCGFFKRRTKVELEELKLQLQTTLDLSAFSNVELVDNADDSYLSLDNGVNSHFDDAGAEG